MKNPLRMLVEPFLRRRRRRQVRDAIAAWNRQQDEQRSQFAAMAAASGTPRGLLWEQCEWSGQMRFARERSTGLITAFSGVVVRFEAVVGDEMEDVEAVSMPRDAVAVFHYRRGRWGTGGRTLFNMTPDEATRRLEGQFETIDR